MARFKENINSIWQVAGGSISRSYSDIFMRYGVCLLGPGDSGPWRADRLDDEFDGSFVRRFASELQIGDAILLRVGISTINAIGIVASDYMYLNQFDDVNGWDLQHARRIHWTCLLEPYSFKRQVFGANPSRISRILNDDIRDYVLKFINSPPTTWQMEPLPDLPQNEPELDEIPVDIQNIVSQAYDLTPLFLDKTNFGDLPTEDELVAHFVVPFLVSLRWPPEQIAVKWRYIDIAVFNGLPRTPENCAYIIEAKRFGVCAENALEQAKRYLESIGVQRDVVVTDGIRYRLYSHKEAFEPVAYANLARLKHAASDLFNRLRRH